ncbi:hypothetical protein KFL_001340080 [Klebsormidium nitens]|uniref:phytol kinase n=1 Tax=Klebsormidium nitens TaxID=105231 RepID=A0A1Y1HWN0_KLENI|nr:hypothetical protein KFL_001340080 [Klebsormidium nitens]|eukprot:GAQ83054.1 hypothetical protein KFL_001340080 [Klebsormidium nitens]
MAEGKSKVVADFLALIDKKDYRKAAEQYEALVFQVAGDTLLSAELEHQLHLRPTKPYKKLIRLLKDERAVRGILFMLLVPHVSHTVLAISNTIAPAPGLAKLLASCETSVDTLLQLGSLLHFFAVRALTDSPAFSEKEEHAIRGYYIYTCFLRYLLQASPEFTERAFRGGLLSLLVSNHPFPGQPPRNGGRAELYRKIGLFTAGCVHCFIESPAKLDQVLRDSVAGGLVPWITRFLKMVIAILTRFPELAPRFEIQTTNLFDALGKICERAKSVAPSLNSAAEIEAVLQSVREVKPRLNDTTARFAASVLSNAHKWTGAAPITQPREIGVKASDIGVLCFAGKHPWPTASTVSASREKTVKKLSTSLVTDVAVFALLPGDLRGEATGQVQRTLSNLVAEMEEGIKRGEISRAVIDTVGSDVLNVVNAELSKLPASVHPHLVGLLILCFNAGEDTEAKWHEYTRVLIGVNLLTLDRRANLVWPFVMALFGALDWEKLSDGMFGAQLVFMACFKKSRQKASSFLHADDVMGLEFPAVLDFVVANVAPLTRFLEWVTVRFAYRDLGKAGRPRGPPPSKVDFSRDDLIHITLMLEPLYIVFVLAFEASRADAAARERFLSTTAVNGGLATCRAIMKSARATLLTSGVASPAGCDDDDDVEVLSRWYLQHMEYTDKLWAAYAEHFKLRPCSNPECVDGVIEFRRATFKSCSACSAAQYCSRECQLIHWKRGHKQDCKKAKGQANGSGQQS